MADNPFLAEPPPGRKPRYLDLQIQRIFEPWRGKDPLLEAGYAPQQTVVSDYSINRSAGNYFPFGVGEDMTQVQRIFREISAPKDDIVHISRPWFNSPDTLGHEYRHRGIRQTENALRRPVLQEQVRPRWPTVRVPLKVEDYHSVLSEEDLVRLAGRMVGTEEEADAAKWFSRLRQPQLQYSLDDLLAEHDVVRAVLAMQRRAQLYNELAGRPRDLNNLPADEDLDVNVTLPRLQPKIFYAR